MTLEHFKNKWDDKVDENLKQEFLSDTIKLVDGLYPNRFQQVAIEVLSEIPDAELKMSTVKTDSGYIDGRLYFGKDDNSGIVVSYSLAVGLQPSAWFELLRCAVKYKYY